MHVVVINAPGYTNRKQFQIEQANRLGLDLHFIDAVGAGDLSEQFCQSAADQWTRNIRTLDVACFLSHRRAWRYVSQQKDPVLIIEDDAVFSPKIVGALNAIKSHKSHSHCAYDLEFVPRKHWLGKRPEWRDDETGIAATRIYQNKIGLAAYVLGPEVAARIHDEETVYAMADAFFWTRPWINYFQIEPAPAVQMRFIDGFKDPDEQTRAFPFKCYSNRSFWSAKRKRLKLSLTEAPSVIAGALVGVKRHLETDLSDFQYALV